MSKFNQKSPGTKTVNLAGGDAFSESSELEFVSMLLTSFAQDQFYRTEKESTEKLKKLITQQKNKKFAAQAAIYARNEFGMRSISHIAAAELVRNVKGETWTKNFIQSVVRRVDDMTEIVAYYLANYKKPIPNCLKKGLRQAFGKFDEYQLAKYRAEKSDVSLVDLVNLLHPKPTEKNGDALKKLVNGELKSTETWETKLTQAGQIAENDAEKSELKSDAWRELLQNKKLGYFALLRNLRNILEQAPDVVDLAIESLVDEKSIRGSLVLPFRFLTAVEEIQKISGKKAQSVIMALNRAIDISCQNVPKFDGNTVIMLDISGSMEGKAIQIGSLFAALLIKSNNADLVLFNNYAKYLNLNPLDSTLSLSQMILNIGVGGGTNFQEPFRAMNQKYDRIIILSDMQGWMTGHGYWGSTTPSMAFAEYRDKFQTYPHVYSWDLAGYGTLQFPEKNIYCLAGFSEKVFDIMKLLETDRNALVNEIKKIEL